MSRKALVPLNILPLSAAPTTPTLVAGDLYWDTTASAVSAYTGSAWSPVAHLSNANTFTTSPQQINGAASAKGLIIKMNATTPGNPLEIQNSSATALFYVDSSGNQFTTSGNIYLNSGTLFINSTNDANGTFISGSTGRGVFILKNAANIGLVVKGAASQTADLQQWQDSTGGVLAKVDKDGKGTFAGLTVTGDLTVGGTTTTVNATNLVVSDPLVYFGENNNSNTVDLGFVASYNDGTYQHSGLVRDATDGKWKLFKGVTDEPTTVINFAQASYPTLLTGTYEGNNASLANNADSIVLTVKGNSTQTADLQQWQNSSATVLAKVNSSGGITAYNFGQTGNYINYLSDISSLDGTGGTLRFNAPASYGVRITRGSNTTSPMLVVLGIASLTGDLQQWQNSAASVLAKIDASGFGTFGNLVVTSSTVPVNGIYLPAANTLGFATNSTVRMQIDSTGSIGFPSIIGGATVSINRVATGNAIGWGIYNSSTIQSDVTNTYRTFASIPSTQATTFTLGSISHFYAGGTTVGSGSTITNIYGFATAANLAQATNNYGFFANSPAAASVWNFFAAGTAANYFAGQTTVGSTSLSLGSGSAVQQFGVVNAAAGNVAIVIRGAASQSSNLMEWQNSAATNLGFITSSGQVYTPQVFAQYFTNRTNTGAYFDSEVVSGTFSLIQRTTTAVNLIVKAVASQTANLQEWQNSSGTVLSGISATGYAFFGTTGAAAAGLTVKAPLDNFAGIIVRPFSASQTANLTEWQDSSGSVLSNVAPSGIINGVAFRTTTGNSNQFGNGAVISGVLTAFGPGGNAAIIPIVVKGAASQTANLQEWQNSGGTVLALIGSDGRLLINGGAGFYTAAPTIGIRTLGASTPGLIVRGAASQTARLQEWQDSTGAVRSSISADGTSFTTTQVNTEYVTDAGSATPYFRLTSNTIQVLNRNVGYVNLTVKGFASQTADLTQWQNSSGTVLAKVDSNGNITAASISSSGTATTVNVNTAVTLDTVALANFTTLEYVVSIKQGTKIRSSKVLVQTDGTSVDSTEFSILETGGLMAGVSVTASVSSTNCILTVTITDAATTNATVKILKSIL